MADMVFGYTVFLTGTVSEEDARAIANAIQMIKGVAEVVPHPVANPDMYFAQMTARSELAQKMIGLLLPEGKKGRAD